jgi:hypothetical protein
MTTTRIREKISALVGSQLPEFIQSDFPTFVSFIEAYYRFLEQDQGALELVQNARSYNDIDTTTDDFVKYFLKNYAANFPENTLVNKRFLVKRINDIYTAKGSSLSFDVLFRTIFDTSVEVKTPFDFVLRASDGRWDQRVSLRLKTISGNRNDLQNRFLPYKIGGIDYSTPIINVKNLTSTLTEVFLDRNLTAPNYKVGDVVRVFDGSGNVVFTGTIEPTISGFSVLRPGSGFKVGQVYNVSSGGAVGTAFKITKISSTGGLEEIKFITYGYGFDSSLSTIQLDFDPTKNVSEVSDIFGTRVGVSDQFNFQILDTTTQDYFSEDYVSFGYTGNLFNQFTIATTAIPSSTTIGDKSGNIATISFTLNALSRYPGQFTVENGFLSEPDVRLQDSLLYQAFAYQTSTNLDIEEFFNVVKSLIHPAGQRLFNNRTIFTDANVFGNVSVISESNIYFEARSTVSILDNLSILRFLTFSDDIVLQDNSSILTSLSESDDFSALDSSNITININKQNDVNLLDAEEKLINFGLSSTVDPLEIIDEISIQLDISNNVDTVSDFPQVAYSIVLDSDAFPLEEIDLNYSDIQDSSVITDSVTLVVYESFINNTDAVLDSNISGLLINYTETGYFQELYTGEKVI